MSLDKLLPLGQEALELGLVNSLTVLALFLSYSMLNVCDLSTDGCFTLGAVVGAIMTQNIGLPWLTLPAAMMAGMLSGLVTAVLQTRMGVQSLLAGIVVNTALYSVNMAISGNKAQITLSKITLFKIAKNALKGTFLSGQYNLVVLLIIVALVILFLSFFLRTKLGLAIRATGNNVDMVRSSSINPAFTTTVGLCVSNSFTALSGCLMALRGKSYDSHIGSGVLTVALASLLIGGVFLGRRRSIPLRAIGAVLGAVIFRLVYALALLINIPAFLLYAVSSVIVVAAISAPYLKSQAGLLRRRVLAGRERGRDEC